MSRSERERAIAAVAERQHGVVTSAQLSALGIAGSVVRYRVRSGRLRRLHRGVYAVAGAALDPAAHWLAAVLACGLGAVLSHRSAAALWGIRKSAAVTIDITAPARTGPRRDGIRVHRADRLPVEEITERLGVPCTTVARTLIDLAGVLAFDAFEYALHSAQTQRLVDRAGLIEAVNRSPRRRGTAAVRRALSLQVAGEDQARSGAERALLRLCLAAGLPRPEVNRWIPLPDGGGLEVDLAWPDARLIVEVDSRAYHATDRAFHNDRRRDRLLTAAGWRVVRFTARDIRERPAAVVAELGELLASAPIRIGTVSPTE